MDRAINEGVQIAAKSEELPMKEIVKLNFIAYHGVRRILVVNCKISQTAAWWLIL